MSMLTPSFSTHTPLLKLPCPSQKRDTRETAGSIRAGKNKSGLCHVKTHRPRVIKISAAPHRTAKKTNSARAIKTSSVHTESAVPCGTRSHTPRPPWQLAGRPVPSEQRRLPLSLALAPPPLPPPPTRLSPHHNAPLQPRARPRPAQGLAWPGQPASRPPPTWPPIPARCAVPPSPAQQPGRLEARSWRGPAALLPRRFLRGKAKARSWLEQQQPAAKGGRR
jgi:hypothetical protein